MAMSMEVLRWTFLITIYEIFRKNWGIILNQNSKEYTESLSKDFIIQGLIALLNKVHPEANVLGDLAKYVEREIQNVIVSGGASSQEQEAFRHQVRNHAVRVLNEGRNANI